MQKDLDYDHRRDAFNTTIINGNIGVNVNIKANYTGTYTLLLSDFNCGSSASLSDECLAEWLGRPSEEIALEFYCYFDLGISDDVVCGVCVNHWEEDGKLYGEIKPVGRFGRKLIKMFRANTIYIKHKSLYTPTKGKTVYNKLISFSLLQNQYVRY